MLGTPNAQPRWRPLFPTILAACVLLAACDNDTTEPEPPAETIASLVEAEPQFSMVSGLLESAGLVEILDDVDETFTVFAPTNPAFAPFNLERLGADPQMAEDILLYHVVGGAAVAAEDLSDGQTVETLSGDRVLVRIDADGDVLLDGSRVTMADLMADNGIVHAIDRVMVGNQDLATVASLIQATDGLYQVVVESGLGEAFAQAEAWTVFAPNNQAFEDAEEVLADLEEEEVAAILQYHVISGQVVNSTDLLALLADGEGEISVPTAQGAEIVITQVDETTISFNDGQATLDLENVDFFASNGIIHLIDGILLPPDSE